MVGIFRLYSVYSLSIYMDTPKAMVFLPNLRPRIGVCFAFLVDFLSNEIILLFENNNNNKDSQFTAYKSTKLKFTDLFSQDDHYKISIYRNTHKNKPPVMNPKIQTKQATSHILNP